MKKDLFLNKTFVTGALALALSVPTAAMVAYASDQEGGDSYIELSAEETARYTQALEAQGYTVVEIEAEKEPVGDIEVEVEATKDGQEFDIYLDAETAEIVEIEKES